MGKKNRQATVRRKNVNTGQIVEDTDGRLQGNARWREINSDDEFVDDVAERVRKSVAHPNPIIQARRERAAIKQLETAKSDKTAPPPIGSVVGAPPEIDPEEARRRGEYDTKHRIETDVSTDAAAREAGEDARKEAAAEQKRREIDEAERLRKVNIDAAAEAEARYKTTGQNPDVLDAIASKERNLTAGPGSDAKDPAARVSDNHDDQGADENGQGAKGDGLPDVSGSATNPDAKDGPSDSWTVAELKDYAGVHNIELGGATVKADILKAVTK